MTAVVETGGPQTRRCNQRRPARADPPLPCRRAHRCRRSSTRTCTAPAPPTCGIIRRRPGARRTGASPRCAGCAASPRTPRSRASSAPTTTPSCRRRIQVIVRRVTGDEAVGAQGRWPVCPTDRPSARAWEASTSVLLIDVPAQVEVDRAGGHHLRRYLRRRRPSAGHVIVRVGAQAQRPGRDGARGQRHAGRQHRDRRR